MSLKTDKVQLEILIKGDKSRAELVQLEAESKKLRQGMRGLKEDSQAYIDKMEQLRKVESRMAELKKEIGLTGMTMRELRQEAKSLSLALNNMDPRSPKFEELKAQLEKVNARMAELKGKSAQAGFSFGKMADGFNRYMGVFAALSASIIGVVFSMRKMVDAFDEYEQRVANLGALTGLAGQDLEWLSNRAKELSVSTTDSGVKITKSADDIVDAFTKMGSARPELLKDKDALAKVTEQALILSEASQMDLDTSINAVAASMNQFNLTAGQSSRIINVLAAGSLEGSAEVDSLTGSLKNVGTVAEDSNLSLEQTVAALEVLAEKQYKGEEAGTKFRGALLKLKEAGVGYASGQFNLRDALIETNIELGKLGSEAEKDALKQKMFGAENVTVGTILLGNIQKYDDLTKAVTGTNVATTQATKNTSTHKAELAQAKNQAKLMSIELGEKLAPIMTFSTNTAVKFVRALFEIPNVVRNNKAAFIALGIVLIAYNTQKLKAIALKAKELVLMKAGFTQRIKEAAQWQYMIFQDNLATIQKAKLAAGMGKLQGVTQRLFAIFKMNPFGAVVIAIGAVVGAVYLLQSAFSKTSASQKAFNEANKLAGEYAAGAKAELMVLAKTLLNTKTGTEANAKAIQELNKSYGKYLPNLLTENATRKEILASLVEINNQIELEARLQAFKETQTEAIKKQIELQDKVKKAQQDYNESSAAGAYFRNEEMALNSAKADLANQDKKVSDLTVQVTKLRMEYIDTHKAQNDAADDAKKNAEDMKDLYASFSGMPESSKIHEEQKSAYEQLNAEIAKYEELLKNQILLKDPKQNNTLEHLNSLKKERDNVEELMKLYNEIYEIQNKPPTKMEGRENVKTEDKLAERTSYEKMNAEWEEAKKNIDDLMQSRKQTFIEAQKNLVDIGIKATETLFAYQERRMNRRYKTEKEAIQNLYDKKLITEDVYNKRIEALEKKKRLSQARIEKKKEIFKRSVQIAEITRDAIKSIAAVKIQASVLNATPATIPFIPMALAQIPVIAGIAALQAGMIAAQPLPAIDEYSKGKYPAKGKSGRMYDTNFVGLPKTGIYKTPTLGIFSEKGDELVIDNPTLRNLQRNAPAVIRYIYQAAGKVPEFAEGKYPAMGSDISTPVKDTATVTVQDNTQVEALLMQILIELRGSYTFKDLHDKLQTVSDNKAFIKANFTSQK